MLTAENGWFHFAYGGARSDRYQDDYRLMLSEWWSINNKDDALAVFERLANGQEHSQAFEKQWLPKLAKLEKASTRWDPMTREMFDKKAFLNQYGIKAWDYGRAQSVLAFAYQAGYLSLKQAREQAMPLAKKVQTEFASWEAVGQSYLLGYLYWTENYDQYRQQSSLVGGLYNDPKSPWVVIPWNLDLNTQPLL